MTTAYPLDEIATTRSDPSPYGVLVTDEMHDEDLPFPARAFWVNASGTLTLRERSADGTLHDIPYEVVAGSLVGPFLGVTQVRSGSPAVVARA